MRTHRFQRFVPALTALTVLGGALLLSSVAHAANYTVCVDIQVQNTDSGFASPTDTTEDYYLTSDPTVVPGRGFYIKVVSGTSTLAANYADPNTGCIQFSETGSTFIADVKVRSVARHGTSHVRAHDGGSSGGSAAPGTHFEVAFADLQIAPNVTRRVTIPANASWNAFATGSFALSRVATGLAGKTIQMGFDDAMSSASFTGAASWIEDDSYLIRVNNASRRLMFEVVHEMGHAAARLNYGHNGIEDTYDTGFQYAGTTANGCTQNASYNISSVEWDSVAYKESFANLYAARVFNDRDSDGAIRILGRSISLERFQDEALGNPQGGHLRNHCYVGSTPPHGVSTIEDWTRFLWDLYTIPTEVCGEPQLGLDKMYEIYSATRSQAPTDIDEWHTDIMSSIAGLGSLSSCVKGQAENFANWNAIGGVYHTY